MEESGLCKVCDHALKWQSYNLLWQKLSLRKKKRRNEKLREFYTHNLTSDAFCITLDTICVGNDEERKMMPRREFMLNSFNALWHIRLHFIGFPLSDYHRSYLKLFALDVSSCGNNEKFLFKYIVIKNYQSLSVFAFLK